MVSPARNSQGSVHILMTGIVLVFVFGGLGTLGVLRLWRHTVETQLRLNQCLGRSAQQFRDHLNGLLDENQEIRNLRKAIEAAEIEPWLIPPLRVLLEAVVLRQEITLVRWQVRCREWLVFQGCDPTHRDVAGPLPEFNFFRGPSDSIGAQPLRWMGVMPRSFRFQLKHAPRAAAATVQAEELYAVAEEPEKWIAVWATPL
jgi:hypothetical protein